MQTKHDGSAQEVTVRRIGAQGGQLAVYEFQGKLRDLVVSGLQESFLNTGEYSAGAKRVSPQAAKSIAVAGVAGSVAALASGFSSRLFMATADPSTLMQVHGGFGSAVIGANGIAAQAPFLPVSAVLPTVAPLLAVQALQTVVIMQEFKRIDQKLDRIKGTLDRVLARIEATHVGSLLASSVIVDELYGQHELEGSFSRDMLMRLAFAERDVRALSARFRQLVRGRAITEVEDLAVVKQANYDAHSAMLSSFLELRIAYLRVCVDLQENPKSVASALDALRRQIDDDLELWQSLLDRSRVLKGLIDARKEELKERGSLGRVFSGAERKELEKFQDAYAETTESEREIMVDFHSFVEAAKETRKAMDQEPGDDRTEHPTLVYWEDETGEHSFVSPKPLLE
ncbi:hypothetical protein [Pseudoclavibacter sp. CFCC 11306]|uniref:hypothetical protein n=1 Tax=Pseudoclavibacter sp. CFCC 11306 TaxID=1564493 RepID=UPI0013014942|nr:hypothetical protein [Pseudoclavibacter sp. CFCC 11306]KAB1658877.1 hypothetical protein F8O09_04710 [Pseudoclavibacter sp. CFCC 11306]